MSVESDTKQTIEEGKPVTITQERRTDVYLKDPNILQVFMELHHYSVRNLADAVERELRKKDKRATCSPASIGHLRSGKRSYVSTDRAFAISKILTAPESTLFTAKVSNVARETPAVRSR